MKPKTPTDWKRVLGWLLVFLAATCGCYPTLTDLDVASIREGATCAHVSLCQDDVTLYDCINGAWRRTSCVHCIPAGEPTVIGVQEVPVCMR